MSTTRNACLRTVRRSAKKWRAARTLYKTANKRSERQRNFRYQHHA